MIERLNILFFRGDEIVVGDMDKKLSELEERASELDKARTQTIQSISYINDRNRKRNVERAEEAILVTTNVHIDRLAAN
jgi:RNA polymerase-associated protein RTF1